MFLLKLPKIYYKILFYIAVIVVLILALVPNDHVDLDFDYADKIKHISAFFTLSLLLNRASSTMAHRFRNMGALLLFGILIEILQSFTHYRNSGYDDVIADAVGIIFFQVSYSFLKFIQKKRRNGR